LTLIQACRHAGVRKILFASSGGTVYGEQEVFPCDESHPTRPLSPYGCAKLAVELYLEAYARLGDLEPIILRYANVYGPRQDPKGEAGIVAILAEKFLGGEIPRIFGDGSQTRDYVFVEDIAAASRAAISNWRPGTYNVGTGRETALADLYAAIADALGVRVAPRYVAANPAELTRNCLDATKIGRELGWRPRVALADGLQRTLPFYRARLTASAAIADAARRAAAT
jgi:UDP-glucose 4-epimerase